MSISVGQLHSASELLARITDREFVKAEIQSLNKILICPATDILNLCLRCGWVEVDIDSTLKPTARGLELHTNSCFESRLRMQLLDVIVREQPTWANLFPKGRLEASNFLGSDVKQCLTEANLLNTPPTDEVVEWWDDISGKVRGIKSASLNQIGRTGEKLTLAFEENRTKHIPKWQSVDSNLCGYDILSVTSESDKSALQIEVKATERELRVAEFYISQNEWETATLSRNYLFHIWLIYPKPMLALISPSELSKHIPSNQGDGQWQSVRIPYRVFDNKYFRPSF